MPTHKPRLLYTTLRYVELREHALLICHFLSIGKWTLYNVKASAVRL